MKDIQPYVTGGVTGPETPDLGTWFQLLNLGVAGVGLFLFVSNRIVSGKQLEKTEKRAEDAEKREQEMVDLMTKEVVPALTRATDAVSNKPGSS